MMHRHCPGAIRRARRCYLSPGGARISTTVDEAETHASSGMILGLSSLSRQPRGVLYRSDPIPVAEL